MTRFEFSEMLAQLLAHEDPQIRRRLAFDMIEALHALGLMNSPDLSLMRARIERLYGDQQPTGPAYTEEQEAEWQALVARLER